MAYSFSTQGATPNSFLKGFNQNAGKNPFLSGMGTTPQSKALSTAQGGQSSVQGTPQAPSFTPPSTPVKKTTVNNVDGSSHTTEYHAPVEQKNAGMTTPSGVPITGNPATYSGIIPQSGDQSQNTTQNQQPTPQPTTFSGILGGLANFDPFKNPAVSGAYDKTQELNRALAESKKNEAGGTATLLRQAIPLGDQEGQARVLQDQYLKQQEALASEMQGQANIFGAGFTGTGQQQSALSSAGGLAQPSGTYPFVFDPVTGGFKNASTGGVLTPQDAAKAVISGQMSYEQAKSSLGYLGQTGEAQLNSAVTNAGGNPLQLQASGSATQSNIGQQNTAQTDIARQGLQKATEDYIQMTGAAQFAGQQASAVSDILTKTGLNNTSSTDYNKAINNLRTRFSDTDYASLDTALREAQSAYARLLSTGGNTPTFNDKQSMAVLDISKSASAINAAIQQLQSAVSRRLQAQEGIKNTYAQNLQGTSQGNTQSGNSYTSPSGNTYTLPY